MDLGRFKEHWSPKPIHPPTVDPEMLNLNSVQRATESIRFSLLSLEWWLSPNGKLREWVRLNGKVGSVLLVPAVLVFPLVTLIIWQIAKWIACLVEITSNLIILPLAALAAGILITGVVIIARALLGK